MFVSPSISEADCYIATGPVQALAERSNWLRASITKDPFGKVSWVKCKAWLHGSLTLTGCSGQRSDHAHDQGMAWCIDVRSGAK